LHLSVASRGRPIYSGLVSGAHAGDGLDGTEAITGGNRAW
jgi:hypothetical protein